jgi:hypothetical protein
MDNATAIKLINKNEPGLIVEDAGSHLNLRRVGYVAIGFQE